MDNASRSDPAPSDPVLVPIRRLDFPGVLDVADGEDPSGFLGWAHFVGWILDGGRPVATYRVVVGGEERPGLFLRDGRRFEPVVP